MLRAWWRSFFADSNSRSGLGSVTFFAPLSAGSRAGHPWSDELGLYDEEGPRPTPPCRPAQGDLRCWVCLLATSGGEAGARAGAQALRPAPPHPEDALDTPDVAGRKPARGWTAASYAAPSPLCCSNTVEQV